MNDRKFDKLIKNSVQQDRDIDSRVDNLFIEFQNKSKNEYKTKTVYNFMSKLRYAMAVVISSIVVLSGGLTYAHINGVETIISPILRNLGINSKYEENAIKVNEEKESNSIKIEMSDMALDESNLIVGYKIAIKNIDSWIDILGEYQINSINIQPTNESIDKCDEYFVLYQIFDISDIKFNNDKIKFVSKIDTIVEYMEVEDLYYAYNEEVNRYEGDWNFEKSIEINNILDKEEYIFENKDITIYDDVEVSIDSYVESSYTNMIRVKMDKTNYNDDSFDYYYIITDKNGNEVIAGVEEKSYDYTVYYDRLYISDINKNEKMVLKVIANYRNEGFEKVGEIEFSLSEGIKKEEEEISKMLTYESENYSFKYNDNWEFLDDSIFGPNAKFEKGVIMRLPLLSESSNDDGLLIVLNETEGDLDSYVEELIASYENEYFLIKKKEACIISGEKSYKITSEISDGSLYVYEYITYIIEKNGKIYDIQISGSQKEQNNNKENIEGFIDSFILK